MGMDIRDDVAQYYDLSPHFPEDIPFYRRRILSAQARVLELGCGTGRVLVELAESCGRIFGVDASAAMLAICRQKLAERGIPPSTAGVRQGDITRLALGETFDLILAPFRVFQNLESDEAVSGYFETVRTHLAPGGRAIVNVFQPNLEPNRLRKEWCTEEETFAWEVPVEGGRVTLHDRRPKMDRQKLVLYPELVYRRYEQDVLVDQAVLPIAMRCYYADDLIRLVEDQGFGVVNTWGGYAGEPYGEGPELIVEFKAGA